MQVRYLLPARSMQMRKALVIGGAAVIVAGLAGAGYLAYRQRGQQILQAHRRMDAIIGFALRTHQQVGRMESGVKAEIGNLRAKMEARG